MHSFTFVSLFFLSLFSLAQSSPVVRQASNAARELEERALIDLPVTVDLGTISLGVRALVGDATCPVVSGDGINARVFASVQLGERLSLDGSVPANLLGLVGLNVRAKAVVEATVNVCLCVRAGVDVGLIDIPTNLNAAALADLKAAANANVNLGVVSALLGALGVNVDVGLTPIGKTDCTCSAVNQFPTCTGGTCGCGTCPAGQIYNPSTGVCVPTPSSSSGNMGRRALANGSHAQRQASYHRQAKRADVVGRMQVKVKA